MGNDFFRNVLIFLVLIISCSTAYSQEKLKNTDPCRPFAISKAYPHLFRIPDYCPGYDDFEPGMANISIGGQTSLNIPRLYLINKGKADGLYTDFILEFQGVNLIEKDKAVKKENLVGVTLGDVTNKEFCGKDICKPIEYVDYYVVGLGFSLDSYEQKKDVIKKAIMQDNSLNLQSLQRGKKKLYFDGDISEPEYWLLCNPVSCKSAVFIENSKISITYDFYKESFLKDHYEIRKNIIKKIKEFIVK